MDDLSYQLNVLKSQISSLNAQLNEINETLKEIKDVDYAYSLVSTIMVKKSKKEIEEELNDKKEMIEIKLKSMKDYLKKIQMKINEKQD